jgi:hypothetical protein
MNSLLKRVLKITGILVFLLLLLFFGLRNVLLHYAIDKVAAKLATEKGLDVKIGSASFEGFSTIAFGKISVVPHNGDTLMTADTLSLRPSVWKILTATLRIKEVKAEGVLLQIVHKSTGDNYDFIKKGPPKVANKRVVKGGYGYVLSQLMERAFNLAPQRAEMKNVAFRFVNDTLSGTIRVNTFHSDEGAVKGELEDLITGKKWECSGTFSQLAHQLDIFVFPTTARGLNMFLLKQITGASLTFDSAHVVLDGFRYSNHELKIDGLASVSNFAIQHKKISEDTIKVNKASISYSFTADENSFMLDSSSVAQLGEITIHPYIRFQKDAGKKFSLKLTTDSVDATRFFQSLPQGMFDEVRTIEADGSLKFGLNFFLDSEHPDDVVFDCSMKKNKFRIRKFNSSDLGKMGGEFSQAVYENDRYIRSFMVGPSNPYFTPIDQVSPNFKNAVLTSEDGNFFFHNGFNEDAFRKSIATNFKAGRFLRGGSTISMQLVKNVFLDRKKTVARKAEEALIVWLIESNRIYSKDRMFEVYLNIIELGPNIYGIGEASQFYFKKKPSEITLQEGIFLASLLPHPKWFRYSFDPEGNLKPFLASYYRIVSNFLLRKGLITQEEHDNLLPNVKITGPAHELIMPTDTILPVEEEQILLQ